MRNTRLYLFIFLLLVSLLCVGCGASDNGIGGDWNPPYLRRIAFTVERDGYQDIYTIQADGSNRVRLTADDTEKSDLAWSPDGTKLAYTSDSYQDTSEIWSVDDDGKNHKGLTSNPMTATLPASLIAPDSNPTWSPDGSKIAFISSDWFGESEIWVMDADGSNQTKLTYNNTQTLDLDWSSDGTQIVFKQVVQEQPPTALYQYETWVMNADGTDKIKLASEGISFYEPEPSMSPDGTKVVYSSFGTNDRHIRLENADGTETTKLTVGYDDCRNPSRAPDGSLIAFISRDYDSHCDELWVMNADGSNKVRLTDEGEDCSEYAWAPGASDALGMINDITEDSSSSGLSYYDTFESLSPDGSKLLRYDDLSLYVMNPDGPGKEVLVSSDGDSWALDTVWSPDSSRVAYRMWQPVGSRSGMWVINADGSNPVKVGGVPIRYGITSLEWSADGTEMTYTCFDAFAMVSSDSYYEPGPDKTYTVYSDGSGVISVEESEHTRFAPSPLGD